MSKDQKTETGEWYLPGKDGTEPAGPFTTEEITKQIEKGLLRIDYYTWSPILIETRWHRFYELQDFQNIMAKYPSFPVPKRRSHGLGTQQRRASFDFSDEGEYGKENIYRRFPRAPINAIAVIHNQKEYLHGSCIDVSEKGLFLNIPDLSTFEKGEEVTVTIRNAMGIGSFSTRAVVVRNVTVEALQGIGIFFLRINPKTRRQIAKYVLETLKIPLRETPSR